MKEKNRLFSIGILSKLTGVHVRCLRYYEKLGILKPEYVNSDSLYRYYSYRQMRIVEAIQYCVELDIPLKKFVDFFDEKKEEIDYASLIAYGKRVTDEKMKKILLRQHFVEEMHIAMTHAQKCNKNGQNVADFEERYVYCLPFEGNQSQDEFQVGILRLINSIQKKGFKVGFDIGMLLICNEGKKETYIFAGIKEPVKNICGLENIKKLPKGKYLCVKQNESSIDKAQDIFLEEFEKQKQLIVIETELFVPKYNYKKPMYELSCSLHPML